jgi:hypothetical protein
VDKFKGGNVTGMTNVSGKLALHMGYISDVVPKMSEEMSPLHVTKSGKF